MQGTFDALKQTSAPLPEQPVGVGARWQVATIVPATVSSPRAIASITTILRSRSADSVVMDISGVVVSGAAPIQLPGLPEGTTVEVEHSSGSSNGTMTMDLATLLVTGESSSESETAMVIVTRGQRIPVTMTSTTTVNISVTADGPDPSLEPSGRPLQ